MSDSFDVSEIRNDFPNLSVTVNGKPIVYLDNAATTFKCHPVIQAVLRHYESETSNVHRGVHRLSELATSRYEAARGKIQRFLNAESQQEIIFTSGTTDSINCVAHSFGRAHLKAGDEVLITEMEHHSNIVPWQMACEATGAKLRVLPFNDAGELCMDLLPDFLSERTKITSVVYLSNSLGTVNPVREIIKECHARNVPVLLDAAQAVSHWRLDVRDLDCDFLVFSGHKLYGPTGTGVLYGKKKYLNAMTPYRGGGDMIERVRFEKTTYNELPYKFEAGTPNIAGFIGLGAAIDYVSEINFEEMRRHKNDVLNYATERLSAISGLRIIGTSAHKASALSFILEGVHAHDLGTLLDEEGVAVRTGHHCTQPVMDHFGISSTSRASFAMYNTKDEVDVLVRAIGTAQKILA